MSVRWLDRRAQARTQNKVCQLFKCRVHRLDWKRTYKEKGAQKHDCDLPAALETQIKGNGLLYILQVLGNGLQGQNLQNQATHISKLLKLHSGLSPSWKEGHELFEEGPMLYCQRPKAVQKMCTCVGTATSWNSEASAAREFLGERIQTKYTRCLSDGWTSGAHG